MKHMGTNLEKEVGPGVLQFSIQQALPCKNSKQQEQNSNSPKPTFCTFHILAAGMFMDWSTPGPISFSNDPDRVITLFSECSIDLCQDRVSSTELRFSISYRCSTLPTGN